MYQKYCRVVDCYQRNLNVESSSSLSVKHWFAVLTLRFLLRLQLAKLQRNVVLSVQNRKNVTQTQTVKETVTETETLNNSYSSSSPLSLSSSPSLSPLLLLTLPLAFLNLNLNCVAL